MVTHIHILGYYFRPLGKINIPKLQPSVPQDDLMERLGIRLSRWGWLPPHYLPALGPWMKFF